MAYQTGRWWSGNAWTSKRFSKRWELFGNVWKRLFLIVGDQHCLRSTFLCLKLWKPILGEASQGWRRAFSGFLRACWNKIFKKKTKMRSCNWLQADTYSSSTAPLYEANASFKTCIKNRFIFWFCCLTQNWFPKFQAKKCGSQTMLISNNEKEAFPNISKQFPPFAESLWCPCIPAPSSARLICHLCLNKTLRTSRT